MWTEISTPAGTMSYYSQRTTTTCCVACGLMMLNALTSRRIDEATLIARATKHDDPEKRRLAPAGYTLEQVVNALTEPPWSLPLRSQRISPGILKMATKARPAIASVENPSFAHAVLVVAYSQHSFVILDPQFGLRIVPFDQYPIYPVNEKRALMRFGDRVVTSW